MRRATSVVTAVLISLSVSAAASTRLIDVPFVPQSEELCGGAAVSMVMRYWLPSDVYAEDFAALVDKSAGGIRVGALATGVRRRGWQAHAFGGTPNDVQTHLEQGRPVIALIEDRPGRFHYVVVVAWTKDRVVFHDPAVNPFRTLDAGAFDRRWQSTGRTALLLLPPAGSEQGEAGRVDGNAPFESTGKSAREQAGTLFLQKRYADAANLAAVAVHDAPDDLASWQLLAASHFLEGEPMAALDAWNRRGEPRVDLARVEGVSRTRYDVVAGLLDLPPRTLVTRDRLARAERRVAALPSVQMSRVSYSPRESGTATVDVAVVERPLVPVSRAEVAASAIYAATMREARVGVASPSGNGELWTTSVRWWNDRPRAAISLALPKLAQWTGAWRLDGSWERQAYVDSANLETERRRAAISFGDWASGNIRWQVGAAIDRWNNGIGTVGSIAGEIERRFVDDHVSVSLDASVSASFGTAAASTRWRSSLDLLSGWHSTALVSAVTRDAPLDLWPAGDTGVARATLLRAHPLLDGGKVRRTELRNVLSNASLEYRRRIAGHPLVQVGWAAFVDTTGTHTDAGVGVRFKLPGTPSMLRVDLARGLRDGAMALSLGWQPSW